jgi:hypothetical protein
MLSASSSVRNIALSAQLPSAAASSAVLLAAARYPPPFNSRHANSDAVGVFLRNVAAIRHVALSHSRAK